MHFFFFRWTSIDFCKSVCVRKAQKRLNIHLKSHLETHNLCTSKCQRDRVKRTRQLKCSWHIEANPLKLFSFFFCSTFLFSSSFSTVTWALSHATDKCLCTAFGCVFYSIAKNIYVGFDSIEFTTFTLEINRKPPKRTQKMN